MRKHLRRWLGGYVLGPRPLYVIERRIRGERFHFSTGCRTERAALKELERFEENPHRYRADGVRVTEKLVLRYRDWMRDERGNSHEWCLTVASFLADWLEDLQGADLRSMRAPELRDLAKARGGSFRHRVVAIKGFCRWLRDEGRLTRATDPAQDIRLPQARPAKAARLRGVPIDRIAKVLPLLSAVARDVLVLQSGTGWHTTEVRRFAAAGRIAEGEGGALAVIVTVHKRGVEHATRIQHPEHLAAAKRLLGRGSIPSRFTLCGQMRSACDRAGVERFGLGVIRHTVATHAVKAGASLQDVARFLGHTSEKTTRAFYVEHPASAVAVPVLRLVAD
jgi:integrase